MRKFLFLLLLASLAGLAVVSFLELQDLKKMSEKPVVLPPAPIAEPSPKPSPENDQASAALEKELERLLGKKVGSKKTLRIPKYKSPKKKKRPPPKPKPPPPKDERAKGRREREKLPLGVVLWDGIKVFKQSTGRTTLCIMQTGDFVRVFSETPQNGRLRVQAGVDLYLAATSKQFEAAGNRFPDKPGWIAEKDLHVFKPQQAIDFTQGTEPTTLGKDPNFSTLGFYERAMKNPDPVVHRVVGPRLIELLGVHEDYGSTWQKLYRDHDSKIRSVTLANLKKRGVGHNRLIMEDLIKRLSELTQRRAQGEAEAEVIIILEILEDTNHPRVRSALGSFWGTWQTTQNAAVVNKLRTILQ